MPDCSSKPAMKFSRVDPPSLCQVVLDHFDIDQPPRPTGNEIVCDVRWNELHEVVIHDLLWPQQRLMPTMPAILGRFFSHRLNVLPQTKSSRLAYKLPAAFVGDQVYFGLAVAIHQFFRKLWMERYWVELKPHRCTHSKAMKVEARSKLTREPVGEQIRRLKVAAESGDPVRWELAFHATTDPARRLIDTAVLVATKRRTRPFRLHPDMYVAGEMISIPIMARTAFLEVLPELREIVSDRTRPRKEAEDATFEALFDILRGLTGRIDINLRGSGERERSKGIGALYFRWLELIFQRRVSSRKSSSTARRVLPRI